MSTSSRRRFCIKGQQGLLVLDRRNANVWFIPKVNDQYQAPVFVDAASFRQAGSGAPVRILMRGPARASRLSSALCCGARNRRACHHRRQGGVRVSTARSAASLPEDRAPAIAGADYRSRKKGFAGKARDQADSVGERHGGRRGTRHHHGGDRCGCAVGRGAAATNSRGDTRPPSRRRSRPIACATRWISFLMAIVKSLWPGLLFCVLGLGASGSRSAGWTGRSGDWFAPMERARREARGIPPVMWERGRVLADGDGEVRCRSRS